MFVDFETGGWDCRPDDGLSADEALLLWSVRRLAIAWPRCHAVHVALQQRYGQDGLGVEHLVRCWLRALADRATRQLTIGQPACPMILPDEAAMLIAVRHAGDGSNRTGLALASLCGGVESDLEGLVTALRALVEARGRFFG